jgi:hypothetical protein
MGHELIQKVVDYLRVRRFDVRTGPYATILVVRRGGLFVSALLAQYLAIHRPYCDALAQVVDFQGVEG